MSNIPNINTSGELQPGTPARVIDIIMDESHPSFRDYGDIGAIRYRLVDSSGREGDIKSLELAYPLSRNIFTYPLLNEIVTLFHSPISQDKVDVGDSYKVYYTTPVAVWNHPHYNPHPDPQLREGVVSPGPGVEEKGDIPPMLPFMGDTLIEGRFGQSIRFTGVRSNQQPLVGEQNNAKPLTIIANGFKQPDPNNPLEGLDADGYTPVVEDINNDVSSIYMTSDHIIPLDLSSQRRGSYLNAGPAAANVYRGAQILMNSDRIVLNARKESMLFSANETISMSSPSTHIEGDNRVVVDAPKVYLGVGAYKLRNAPRREQSREDLQQPVIKGGVAETVLLEILEAIRILVDDMGKAEEPDVYIPIIISAAKSVQDQLDLIEPIILNELKSNKVFVE